VKLQLMQRLLNCSKQKF